MPWGSAHLRTKLLENLVFTTRRDGWERGTMQVAAQTTYMWSSYNAYLYSPGFIFTDMGKDLIGDRYAAYMEEDDGAVCLDMEEAIKGMTDLELSAKIEEILRMPAPTIA